MSRGRDPYGWDFRIGVVILFLLLFSICAAPLLTSYAPDAQDHPAQQRLLPPSSSHLFGTDQFGRDVFTRVLYGGRISLLIALAVVLFSVILGSAAGLAAGYLGRTLDILLMRLVDILLAFPTLFLVITCMALFGSGGLMLIAVLIATGWMDIARLCRAEVHSLKQLPFVLRVRAAGLSKSKIMLSHILPNLGATLTAFSVIRLADIILLESALSFIGLGVQPPTATWGSIIGDGRLFLATAWWISLFPGLFIVMTLISLNWIAQGLKS